MLFEELEKAWWERERALLIDRFPTFQDTGLVLGAGSVFLATDSERGRFIRLDSDAEVRLLVLLSAAYHRRIGGEVLAHVHRAAARWSEGDPALASVHLALGGLGRLSNARESARRLFLAERLLDSGAEPDVVLRALDLDGPPDSLRRVYNPDQPRVPAGNGRESGQWTAGDESGTGPNQSEPEAAPPPIKAPTPHENTRPEQAAPAAENAGVDALSVTLSPAQEQAARDAAVRAMRALRVAAEQSLEDLSVEDVGALERLAAAIPAATVFAGVLLTPTNSTLDEEHAVPGRPGFFYEHLQGEVGWHVFYVNGRGEGVEVSAGPDRMYRDAHGQPIGRLLPNGAILFATDGTPPAQTRFRPPKEVCPVPTRDKFGQGDDSRSRAYENQMKSLLNPEAPTPPGFGRPLPNPARPTGIVIFDDCWLFNGDMFEYKGPGYAGLISASTKSGKVWDFEIEWLNESFDQVTSDKSGRRIVWMFAEPESARFAYSLFQREDKGRENIIVGVFPYLGGD